MAWDWLVVSSVDPYKVSLALKGLLLTVVSFIVPVLALMGNAIDNEQVQNVVDAIAAVVQAFLSLVGAIIFLYGLIRKVYLTIVGKNVGISQ